MSERDTHFAGWAKLQIQKLQEEGLLEAWNPDFGEIDLEKVQRATQLLTQGAYDLAYHVSTFTSNCYTSGYIDTTKEVDVTTIPDLTEWPTKEEEIDEH